jgi:O-antigen ligase
MQITQKLMLSGYHFLLFMVPLFFLFRTDELFEFNKMVLTYVMTIFIVGVWMLRMVAQKRLIWQKTIFDLPIFLFLLSQLISTILSIHPRTSWLGYYSRFHGGLFSWFSYVILYYGFVSNIPRRAYTGLFFTTTLSAIVVSFYAILEHFGHSPSCLILTKGETFGVDCWVQKVQDRVFATFGQPNWLAAYMISLWPATLFFGLSKNTLDGIKNSKKNWLSWFFIAAALLEFLTLLFTKSRSGFLGFLAALAVMALGLSVIWYKSRSNINVKKMLSGSVRSRLLVVSSFLIIAVLAFGTPFSTSLANIIKNGNGNPMNQTGDSTQELAPTVDRLEEGGTDSGEIRKIVWEGAIKVWQRYPLFGSGVETFAYSYYQDRPVAHNMVSEWDFLYNKAHNELLNFLATTGAVGLGSYLLIFVYVAWACLKNLVSQQVRIKDKLFLLALLAGMVAQSVSNFFGFSTVMVTILLFWYLGMISQLSKNENALAEKSQMKAKVSPKNQTRALSGLQYLGITLVAIGSFMLLAKVYLYWSADVAYSGGKKMVRSGQTDNALISLAEAIQKSPSEAIYYDELSSIYASAAVSLLKANEASAAAETAQTAILLSDTALQLNSAHLNIYKTRARVFITLAQLDPKLLSEAETSLKSAINRSPTDAKLWFNLGVVQFSMENYQDASLSLEKTISLKPDYASARIQLAQIYEVLNNQQKAVEHYQYVLENLDPKDARALNAIDRISTSSGESNQ